MTTTAATPKGLEGKKRSRVKIENDGKIVWGNKQGE
jgi:hypothetical protein